MTAPYEKVLVHVRIAESAQPRKVSNVTRPFLILWVGSGDETMYYIATNFNFFIILMIYKSTEFCYTLVWHRCSHTDLYNVYGS